MPPGFVRTYGDIDPGAPRMVGRVVSAVDADDVPWHRVVNAKGTISIRTSGSGHDILQKKMLQREGVRIGKDGRLSLALYRWRPRGRKED